MRHLLGIRASMMQLAKNCFPELVVIMYLRIFNWFYFKLAVMRIGSSTRNIEEIG